ncbi:phenylacetate--CoA ligase family protein [Nonomuraea sp. 3N208]|uniref:phenylacetate--CoA ligase family protein n=1 Tax=Nonomuraea sp. 3N208 TaxID=3457421 RepID=UPI003FD1E341
MLATAARQLRYVATVLRGGRFDVDALRKMVTDLRQTLDEFGEPGDGANELLPGSGVDDPEIRRSMADRRLRQAIRQAAEHTAYYRLWFKEHGVDSSRIGLDQLHQVASTPKSALRGAGPAFVSDQSEPVLMAQTTGTTGTPTVVWFSRYELELSAVLSAISYLMVGGVREHHVSMSCVSSRATVGLISVQRALGLVGAGFVAQGLVDPGIALDRLATPLHLPGKAPHITDLYTVPSYLGALVQRAEQDGWQARDFGLRQILTGAEILTDALRDRVREVFDVPVSDVYGMTELVPTTGLVCTQQHLHLASEQAHFEVLDLNADTPAAVGEIGELVATPYAPYRDTTLLVRYRTGDLVRRLADEPYGCELAQLPATSPIVGRAKHFTGGPTARDVLEVLQGVREVPLPTRYALAGDPLKPDLHVVAPRGGGLLGRIEELATARALQVADIVLVEEARDLPEPCRVRADLYEHSFETSRS